jgi:hypothetical protein
MAGLNRLGLELELETYGTLWNTMENYGKHYGKIQNLRNTMENLVK